jgi:hypothetical protein
MKKLLTSSLFFVLVSLISSYAQSVQKTVSASVKSDVDVYYFHNTIRCVTCKTVEAEARKNLELLYGDLVKSGKVNFTALNIEESTGKSIGAKLGVNSQTLLIVKGDQKINITNEGFLYAVSKPDKFKEVIKSKIDPLLK